MSNKKNCFSKTIVELFFPFYLISLFVAVFQSSIVLIIPLYAIEMGANSGIAALLFGLLGVGRFLSNIPVSFLIARVGYKFSMIIGFFITALIGIFAISLNSLFELGLISFLFGVTVTIFLLSRLTLINNSIEAFHKGKIIASMAGVNRGGNVLGPIIGGYLIVEFGFKSVFMAIVIISLISILIVKFSKFKNKEPEKKSSLPLIKIAPKILKNHSTIFLTAGLAMFFLTLIRNCRDVLIPLWGNFISLNASEIGLILGFSAVLEMLMFPIAGYTLDNVGRKVVALCCVTLLSIGIFLITITSDFYSFIYVIIILGVGNGLGGGVNLTIGSDLASRVGQIEFLGVWRMVSDSATFVGPLLIGYVAKTYYLSMALFLTSGIGILNVFLILFLVKETLIKTSNLEAH